MKRLILDAEGTPTVETVADPAPGPGQVQLRMRAGAFNRRDLWMTMGMYPNTKLPASIGADGCGVVAETAPGVAGVAVGDRVVVVPCQGWGSDPRTFDPRTFAIVGMPLPGTLAERMVVDADKVRPAPPHLTDEEAAALPLAGLTAYRACFTKGAVRKGSTVLVTGIGGGVALCALQLCVAAGARVFVTSSSEAKIRRAVELGAAGGANYKTEGWVKGLVKEAGSKFDTVIDGAGGDDFGRIISATKPGGRIVSYGITAGNPTNVNFAKLFLMNQELLGTTMGTEAEFDDLLAFVNKHKIHPVVDRVLSLDESPKGIDIMRDGSQFGKVVVRASL